MKGMFRGFLLLFIWLVGSIASAGAQPVRATLEFAKDSVALGEIIDLKLTLIHPKGTDVLFPSRRRDFLPFEWVEGNRLTTVEAGGQLQEVMVYQVRTFSLSKKQQVVLPYGFRSTNDTLQGQVASDSIALAERVSALSDTLGYKQDWNVLEVGESEEYSNWILWLGGGVLLIVILFWILRQPVERLLRRRALQIEWQSLRRQVQRLSQEKDQGQLFDQMSRQWRHWLDPKDYWGLPSLTTTELRSKLHQLTFLEDHERQVLLNIAEATDQVIYAGKDLPITQIEAFVEQLLPILHQEYKRRDKAIKARN